MQWLDPSIVLAFGLPSRVSFALPAAAASHSGPVACSMNALNRTP